MNHVIADPETGTIYAGGGNEWFGPAVWKSTDLGASWTHSSSGLQYASGREPRSFRCGAWRRIEAGSTQGSSRPACSTATMAARPGPRSKGSAQHPSRPHWQPGGGGLILHSIVPHPEDDDQLWVGISSAGVFYTADGGQTWQPRNTGVRCDYLPEGQRYPEFGQCVHCLVIAPGRPNRLYQQNHCGMYRSDDGGQSWNSIEAGLPSSFGFPAVAHPRDPETLFLLPLNGDTAGRYMPDAKAAVWRTRNAGAEWQALRQGLPQNNAFFGVLRQSMAADCLDPAGIYAGTNTGILFASADEGESWTTIAQYLPPILSVETLVLDA